MDGTSPSRERKRGAMADYQEFLDGLDRAAYHEGEATWEEDGFTVTRTYQYSPPGCHDSCGVLFYAKDGKLDHVEGDPLSPFTNGKLCMRCLDLPEIVNHPDRVLHPMKRAREDRGDASKFERITWDEAYDLIEEKVKAIREEYGSESIVCVHGTGRNVNWLVPLFGQAALQTPNISTLFFTGFACYMPRVCGAMAPLGDFPIADAAVAHELRYADPSYCPPEVIVVWGNEPLASNADGYIGHWLVQCVQMGSRIISIDPRLTWWGARAAYHLQLRPGTDAALACAWLNVVISEGLYDHEFVDCWTSGIDELWEGVRDMTPAWAAPICGLSEEDIVGSARLYASGNNAAIQWGLAFDQQVSAMALNLAVCDLMAICGNIDRPGGNILVRNSFEINAGYASGEDFTPQSAKDRKLTIARGLGISGGEFIAHAATDGILHCIEAGELPNGDAYPIKMIWFPKLQLARLRRHGRAARLRGAEDGRLHRERRPRPHAAFGRSRRRAAARGHAQRAQLRPHLVDAGAHHVPRRRAGGRGQDRRADSRGPHAAPQPGSRRVVRLDEGHRHRRLVPGRGRRQEARRVVQREGQHFGKGEGRLRHELPESFPKRGATPTTTGTTPTRNMPRACCATTAIPASPRLPAASSWRPTRTASGASRPRRSIPSLPKAP